MQQMSENVQQLASKTLSNPPKKSWQRAEPPHPFLAMPWFWVHMVLKHTPKWANFQIKFAQLQNLCITPREFCFWNHNLKVAAEGTAVENFELFRDCIFQIYLSTMIAYLRRRQRRMQFVDPFIHDHKREEVWQIQIRIKIIKIMFMYGGESTQTVNHFTADYLLFKFFQ